MTTPQVVWDIGTGYDFFVSLHTLHHPADFGLRGSWAVGVRSRLPQDKRDFLQDIMTFMDWPIDWVSTLSEPRDATAVLDALADIPAEKRLVTVSQLDPEHPIDSVLLNVAAAGKYTPADKEAILNAYEERFGKKKSRRKRKSIDRALHWWSQPEAFGRQWLAALQTYYEAFFAEDEMRLRPALRVALADAQAQAEEMPLLELLQELSQGVQFSEVPQVEKLVLAPSFWGSPLIWMGRKRPQRQVILFGGRPSEASIVPGEWIPDVLHQSLKALAEPTRLRILNYVMKEPLTPTELANRLRLRAPTVVHHLKTLRLARLVYVTYGEEGKRYRARHAAIQETYALLDSFLGVHEMEEEAVDEARVMEPA